jgi:hypothetical protein
MKSETKIPRFTYKHGDYYSTLAVDGSTKWIRLSKDKETALLMYESKKGGPVDSKVKEMLQLFKECKQLVKLARATKRTCEIYVYKVEYQNNNCVVVLPGELKSVAEDWINRNPVNKGGITRAENPGLTSIGHPTPSYMLSRTRR